MAIQKNFVVHNGIEVNTDLIFANANTNRVGIATTNPRHTLHVNGGIGATNISVSGISTFNTVKSIDLYTSNAYINSGVVTSLTATSGFITSLTATSAIIPSLYGTHLNYTGITTLGVTSSTHLNTQSLKVSGISTFNEATINNLILNGYLSIGNSTGKDGQILVSTGSGVVWSKLSKNTTLTTAAPGQDTFYFNYEIGSVEIYINGVRLSPNEFTAVDTYSIVLDDPCFGDETVEILSSQTLPTGTIEVPIGISVQENGVLVGVADTIRSLNFIGEGVTIDAVGSNNVDITLITVTNPPGKTVYVAMNGSDSNDGLTLENPKRSVKAAVEITSSGDTVKVSPGTYIENNPITLPENVAIEGAELRNCIITPQNPNSDLFWVTNGTHLTDLSFQGQTTSTGAAVVAFKPLVGVASDRFFDAARIIRYNLDFIASEAVGYLTSTDYRNPPFTMSGSNYASCKDDIKDIFRAICHDITRGGNSKCVGAGFSYYSGSTLQHIVGVRTETIDTIRYAAGIAKSCINNVSWGGTYQREFSQLKDLSIQADSLTGSNANINSCTNVVSAIYSCVGVVTSIIAEGPGIVGTGFNLTYPGNSGIGTENVNDIPSQGVGNVTKGPYIRNCTNFIPGSVGMRVDGFHADPGDKDDMGITGMMSVDSYTQYNQGGIGVKVSNGAYAQLVSIFTICTDEAIVTESGGQCDITNSNSSFGTKGLVSNGVSDPTTLSNYRYTGNVSVGASEGDFSVVIGGVGKEKPYSGQVAYFGELYYEIIGVNIVNGGSGYTEPPTVVFLGDPSGPSGIKADAIAEITNGSVTSINMIGNGRNYRISDVGATATLSPDLGGVSIVPILGPLYYQVRSSTLPSAGISTVTFAQSLNNDVGVGTTTYLFRQSLQIVSSHSFEYIGAGNTIETARPSKGGVTIRENEVIKNDGGEIVYTSTDQDGNFAIGEDLIVDQSTGTIRGRSFERSLLNTVTPFIIALGAK
jgi:hypothetical protein